MTGGVRSEVDLIDMNTIYAGISEFLEALVDLIFSNGQEDDDQKKSSEVLLESYDKIKVEFNKGSK